MDNVENIEKEYFKTERSLKKNDHSLVEKGKNGKENRQVKNYDQICYEYYGKKNCNIKKKSKMSQENSFEKNNCRL